jgi:glutathione S-transferase
MQRAAAPKLFGSLTSQPTRMVLWTAAEVHVLVDLEPMNVAKGDHVSSAFRGLNPNQTFPVLVDGDFVLYESNAICRYLVAKSGQADSSSLYPADIRQRALTDQWLDWKHGDLRSGCSGIVRRRWLQHVLPDLSHHSMRFSLAEVKEEREARQLVNALRVVSRQLCATGAFLVPGTAQPTLADVAVFEEVFQLGVLPRTLPPPFGSDLSGFARLVEWQASMAGHCAAFGQIHAAILAAIAKAQQRYAQGSWPA